MAFKFILLLLVPLAGHAHEIVSPGYDSTYYAPIPEPRPEDLHLQSGRDLVESWRRIPQKFVQIPVEGDTGTVGPCGSSHYSPDMDKSGEVTDNYADPLAACAFVSVLQEWKKDYCKEADSGCNIFWGDISHKTKPFFNGHKSHDDGQCIDIRPLRDGAAKNAPLWYNKGNDYNGNKTSEFIDLLKRAGGSPVLFNDPSIDARSWPGHDNHIHVCFKDSEVTRDRCERFRYDPEVCGEIKGGRKAAGT